MTDQYYDQSLPILLSSAKNLRDELRSRKSSLKVLQGRTPGETWTRGSYLAVAAVPGSSARVELWYDQVLNSGEYNFWVGFVSEKREDIDKLIDNAPLEARHLVTITDDDYGKMEEDIYFINRSFSDNELAKSMLESYKKTKLNENEIHFFGRFFDDYNVIFAADYIENVFVGKNVSDGFYEGACGQRTTNIYERDPRARKACINKNGYVCQICDVDFEEKYGEIGKEFIHVHHLDPLSERKGSSKTSINRLICVCPNCHAMLHRGALKTPEKLKANMSTRNS